MPDPISTSGFVTPGRIITGAQRVAKSMKQGKSPVDAMAKEAQSIVKEATLDAVSSVVGQEAAEQLFETAESLYTQNTSAKMSGGSGGIDVNVKPNFEQGGISPTSVYYSSQPLETKLDTGLNSVIYGNNYLTSSLTWSGLSFSAASINFPFTGPLYNYVTQIVYVELQNSIQGAISFQIPSFFTPDTLITSINYIWSALQTYLFYDSILTYCNNPQNRNDGMFAFRETYIDADGINNLYNLRRIIQGTPIPPNLVTLTYWMMQTYATAELPGASLVKIMPFDVINNSMSSVIQDAIAGLVGNNDAINVISRAAPGWMNTSLPSSNSVPLFDEQFLTFFANLPYASQLGSDANPIITTPSENNITADVNYNVYSNNIDGAVTGLGAIYNSGSSYWDPSLVEPLTIPISGYWESTRINYSGSAFVPTEQSQEWSYQRGETYTWNFTEVGSLTVLPSVPIGTEQANGFNIQSVRQNSYRLVDWFMTLSSIGTLRDTRVYKNTGSREWTNYKSGSSMSSNKRRGGKHRYGKEMKKK
jgi:hypothetical protein